MMRAFCSSWICSCKPFSHLYTSGSGSGSGSLDLEQNPNVKEEPVSDQNCIKSSFKSSGSGPGKNQKKKVQWMDLVGKELVQVTEYELSETEDVENYDASGTGCVCIIL